MGVSGKDHPKGSCMGPVEPELETMPRVHLEVHNELGFVTTNEPGL